MTAAAGRSTRMEGVARLRRTARPPANGGTSPEPVRAIGEWPGCRCFSFAAGAGRHRLWGTALVSTDGLSVNLLGGTVPHIGAVAVGVPRPSLARPRRRSATTSVFALVGHKDDELARAMAMDLARHLGITVVVTAGVHLPRARSTDIAAVMRNAGEAVKAILAHTASAGKRRRRRP